MATRLWPEDARAILARRFQTQHPTWLSGGGVWPLHINLGCPTEKEALEDSAGVRAWVSAWATWATWATWQAGEGGGAGAVGYALRQWPRLGAQTLPVGLSVASAHGVAALVGQATRWAQATARSAQMRGRWPALGEGGALGARFNVLADYSEADFSRLLALLDWLVRHPASHVYLRQLPVAGLDTKWAEQRKGVITGLLRDIKQGVQDSDGDGDGDGDGENTGTGTGTSTGTGNFHELCGLLRPPHRIRIRLLCPALRRLVGGLHDLEAPLQDVAALALAPRVVVIVENLDTGLALPDIAGTVGIMKMGMAVGALAAIPWLQGTHAVYWGDIDTHGFAILNQARQALPGLRSVLMDEATTRAFQPLWGTEPTQTGALALAHLHPPEQAVYAALKAHTWGQNVRLEQERLPWPHSLQALLAALMPALVP